LKKKNKEIEDNMNEEKKEVKKEVLNRTEVLQVVQDILEKERLNQDLAKIEKEKDVVKLENSIPEVDKNTVLKDQEKLPDTNEAKPKFEARKYEIIFSMSIFI
jgi:hypothetical protein